MQEILSIGSDQTITVGSRERTILTWQDLSNQNTVSVIEMCEMLSALQNILVILDDPSGSGKTYILQRLKRLHPSPTYIITVENLPASLPASTNNHYDETAPQKEGSAYSIFCIEDIVFLSGKPITQQTAAQFIRDRLAGHTVVILALTSRSAFRFLGSAFLKMRAL